ncbi:hypothetical protein HPG69_016381 [Diceros bicornis minor]|uniref:thioredoxin-dependent peroxiredoxin n=1 Tax=Diceros bicornis minor TaxID=77932 RepID=A0A7J7EFH6_DICBM|nr:hypothetical protein HPG69_016381 [Diceros bicornis minor]
MSHHTGKDYKLVYKKKVNSSFRDVTLPQKELSDITGSGTRVSESPRGNWYHGLHFSMGGRSSGQPRNIKGGRQTFNRFTAGSLLLAGCLCHSSVLQWTIKLATECYDALQGSMHLAQGCMLGSSDMGKKKQQPNNTKDMTTQTKDLGKLPKYEGKRRKCHIPVEKLSQGVAKPESVDQNRAINTARDPLSQLDQGDGLTEKKERKRGGRLWPGAAGGGGSALGCPVPHRGGVLTARAAARLEYTGAQRRGRRVTQAEAENRHWVRPAVSTAPPQPRLCSRWETPSHQRWCLKGSLATRCTWRSSRTRRGTCGVPGAFTPSCSRTHLPGFVGQAGALKASEIQVVALTSVNDVFVTEKWGPLHDVEGRAWLLASPPGAFGKETDLLLDDSSVSLFGNRWLKRFCMVIEDGRGKPLNLELDGTGRHLQPGLQHPLPALRPPPRSTPSTFPCFTCPALGRGPQPNLSWGHPVGTLAKFLQ